MPASIVALAGAGSCPVAFRQSSSVSNRSVSLAPTANVGAVPEPLVFCDYFHVDGYISM